MQGDTLMGPETYARHATRTRARPRRNCAESLVRPKENARVPSLPMSRQDDLVAAGRRLLFNNYRQAPVVMSRGQGCELFDVEGQRYLDMTAGVAVCVLGHGHAGLADAIAAQARKLLHVSNLYYIEAQIEFAEALARRA